MAKVLVSSVWSVSNISVPHCAPAMVLVSALHQVLSSTSVLHPVWGKVMVSFPSGLLSDARVLCSLLVNIYIQHDCSQVASNISTTLTASCKPLKQ